MDAAKKQHLLFNDVYIGNECKVDQCKEAVGILCDETIYSSNESLNSQTCNNTPITKKYIRIKDNRWESPILCTNKLENYEGCDEINSPSVENMVIINECQNGEFSSNANDGPKDIKCSDTANLYKYVNEIYNVVRENKSMMHF